jgi:hypothetical protein
MLTKREHAREILRALFAHQQRIAIADAMAAGKAQGISRKTIQRASNELGVREIHNGPYGAFWEL